jgi:hypothetical protein
MQTFKTTILVQAWPLWQAVLRTRNRLTCVLLTGVTAIYQRVNAEGYSPKHRGFRRRASRSTNEINRWASGGDGENLASRDKISRLARRTLYRDHETEMLSVD